MEEIRKRLSKYYKQLQIPKVNNSDKRNFSHLIDFKFVIQEKEDLWKFSLKEHCISEIYESFQFYATIDSILDYIFEMKIVDEKEGNIILKLEYIYECIVIIFFSSIKTLVEFDH